MSPRRVWCAMKGHPSRETIYDVSVGSEVTTRRMVRKSCLACGKRLAWTTLADFLLARIAEDEEEVWR